MSESGRVRVYTEGGETTWRCPNCDMHNQLNRITCRDCSFERSIGDTDHPEDGEDA